jgi:putative transposase
MKAGQFTNEQIVAILQEADKGEKPILALCKDKGISEATFYTWRKRFGGMATKMCSGCANWKRRTRA